MKCIINAIAILLVGLSSCNSSKEVENKNEMKLFPYYENDKAGYFDRAGKVVINPQYDAGTLFSNGLAAVVSDGKMGYIDETGKYIVTPQYKQALAFSEGLAAVVQEGGKCQYIDEKGTVKFSADFAEVVGSFYEGLAVFYKDGMAGFMDNTGKVVIPAKFSWASAFSEGLAMVMNYTKEGGNSYGYINTKGELVINYQFRYAFPFSDGLAAISDGKNSGYIDKQGKYVINPQYDYADVFLNGLAPVQVGDKFGYIDKAGKLVITPQFSNASCFSENGIGLAATGTGNDIKYGYINKEGKYIINPQFQYASFFIGNIAFAGVSNDKIGIINEKGEYLVNPQFKISPLLYNLPATRMLMKQLTIESDENTPKRVAYSWLLSFYHLEFDKSRIYSTEETKGFIAQMETMTGQMPEADKEAIKNNFIVLKDVKEDGDNATVVFNVSTYAEKDQELKLVKSNGKWLVQASSKDFYK